MTLRVERRRHLRVALKTPAYLSRTSGDSLIRAAMVNISISGFYCLSAERFLPGEKIQCIVSLSAGPVPADDSYLRGEAKVVRVDPVGAGDKSFGVACQIQNYEILPSHALHFRLDN